MNVRIALPGAYLAPTCAVADITSYALSDDQASLTYRLANGEVATPKPVDEQVGFA